MKNWFEIKAKAATDGPVEAFIYDEIGFFGTTAKDFIAALQPHRNRGITLRINSPGGSVMDGLAIYNYLKGLNVITKVDGIAASMASVVALAGKRVEIAANGFFMVHRPAGVMAGTAEDMSDYAALLAKFEENLMSTYERETGATREEVEKWMSGDTWFSAEEAKAAGLADAITDEVSFSANLDLSKFNNPPAALTARIDSKPNTDMANEIVAPEKTFIESLKSMLGLSATPAAPVPAEAKADPELIQARADLVTAKQTISTLETRVKALETENATAKTDLEKAKTEAATAKTEAEKAASHKAAAITASQGQPALEVKPTETPASTKPDFSKLTGLEKAIAAHRAGYDTK